MKHAIDAVRRILLVALDNLGDLVFASALTPPLHAASPRDDPRLVQGIHGAVARLIPHVSAVVAADPFWAVPPGHARPPVGPFLSSVRAVRRARYDSRCLSEAPWRAAAAVGAAANSRSHRSGAPQESTFSDHGPRGRSPQAGCLRAGSVLDALGIRSAVPRSSSRSGPLGVRAKIVANLPRGLSRFIRSPARAIVVCLWLSGGARQSAARRGLATLWIGTSRELHELRACTPDPRSLLRRPLRRPLARHRRPRCHSRRSSLDTTPGRCTSPGPLAFRSSAYFAPGQPERTFPQGTGAWRIFDRPTPAGITAGTILHEIDALL